ncbi:MAG: ribose 5-phosphate isomerase B [Desulfovibrionaceae bacterium]|nr:ribose 5-phosphate isomerase B [Desulfovibrionaceae bacterium]MBF0513547.1 ribose 5-phosphate isomerase B [Desulfovibrionaceae bacterium]
MATIVIGADHGGVELKKILAAHLSAKGYEIVDLGTDSGASCDYPVYAFKVCDEVLARGCPGILICGSGIGMSMAANRVRGIRAALCTSEFHALKSREHNDANVLCLGERITGAGHATSIADTFLATEFEGGRHQRRVDLFDER